MHAAVILSRRPLLQHIHPHTIQRILMRRLQLHPGYIVSLIRQSLPRTRLKTKVRTASDAGFAQVGAVGLAVVEEGAGELRGYRVAGGAEAGDEGFGEVLWGGLVG